MTSDEIYIEKLEIKVRQLTEELAEVKAENRVYLDMQYNLIMNLEGNPDIIDAIEELQSTGYYMGMY